MKELFRIIREFDLRSNSVMVTILEEGVSSKTLISGDEIIYCAGELDFMQSHIADFGNIHKTGIYKMDGRDIYCEILETVPQLVVCGAGHVGLACIRAGKLIGMNVTCLEDREEFAVLAEDAGADVVLRGNVTDNLDKIEGGEDVFILTMMRAHALDQANLEKILPKESAYVGMLGSAKKIATLKGNLEAKGFDTSLFDKLHSPIGLDINAQTPSEIAIAVIGQIIQVKNDGKDHGKAFSEEQLNVVASGSDAIIATLIRKYDASPREPGTKMIITADGTKFGTIGGGLAEAEATKKAVEFLKDADFRTAVLKVGEGNITETNAGMLCGGIVDVLFERISDETCFGSILTVEGMMCANCEKRVKKALESVEGIVSAHPSHTAGLATVVYDREPDSAQMKKAIEVAGYKLI